MIGYLGNMSVSHAHNHIYSERKRACAQQKKWLWTSKICVSIVDKGMSLYSLSFFSGVWGIVWLLNDFICICSSIQSFSIYLICYGYIFNIIFSSIHLNHYNVNEFFIRMSTIYCQISIHVRWNKGGKWNKARSIEGE